MSLTEVTARTPRKRYRNHKAELVARYERLAADRPTVTVTRDTLVALPPRAKWRQIVDDGCHEYRIHPDKFLRRYGPRRYIPARIAIARRLRAAGYTITQIGRWLCRDHTTISWYCGASPNKRQPVHQP